MKKNVVSIILILALILAGCGSNTVKRTDTIQWFNNTYAVLTKLNDWDYTLYGGRKANTVSKALAQNLLLSTWDITDRKSADESLDWLLTEGHRVPFAEEMSHLEEAGLSEVPIETRAEAISETYGIDPEWSQRYAAWYALYEQYGEDAAAGWDYSRAMSCLSYYYLAGFYTKEESLDQSMEIAETLQSTFDSWDSFMESYFAGYEYWSEESSNTRRDVYEELKTSSDNPFNLDWNITLEKSW